MADFTITTPRTVLRPWKWSDLSDFADMHADEEVMSFVGGPVSIATCTDLIDWYRCAYEEHGFCRWAVQDRDGAFLGCTGVMPMPLDLPIAPGFEIGWRFIRSAWGQGLATEAAQAALLDAFDRVGLPEVAAYCAPDNCRSQAVARRLQMRRDASRDFNLAKTQWTSQVWVAGSQTEVASQQKRYLEHENVIV